MRTFKTIADALNYAVQVLNANKRQAVNIRQELRKKSITKFNGLILIYDEIGLLD
jgi:SOS response regulatory protein OraA/RecX